MNLIEQITAAIISREGGFVNDPDDLGGPTKYGVTLATAQQHNLDKNGDGRVTAQDVKQLTKMDAKRIFKKTQRVCFPKRRRWPRTFASCGAR